MRPGTQLVFMGEIWTVLAVLFSRDWRPFYSIDSEHGEHDVIAADGSDGAYQLLPATARDSDSGRPGDAFRNRGASTIVMDSKAPTDLAETLAPSPAVAGEADPGAVDLAGRCICSGPSLPASTASPVVAGPIPDRFSPRAWRP